MPDVFSRSIKYVKGVGEARAKILSRLGIRQVSDMVNYFPRGYEDRTVQKSIAEVIDGEECTIMARLISGVTETKPRKNLTVSRAVVSDHTSVMNVVWFNQKYTAQNLRTGTEYYFFGKIKRNGMLLEMHNPIVEEAGRGRKTTGRILPVYPLTKGLTQNNVRNIMENALKTAQGRFEEILPWELRKKYKLSEINYSYEQIHFPNSFSDMEAARRRLVFQELLLLQLSLIHLKGESVRENGIEFKPVPMDPLLDKLSFRLTSAQERVFSEIEKDMESPRRMNRLVQGDVGSGKTIVAVMALYKAVRNGFQGAFMVPTEILAEQHYKSVSSILEGLGVSVRLLTGSMKKKEKEEVKELIKSGRTDIVIGTHAILEEDIEFYNLGLVITDEQHRFGVRQRARLSIKGENPDLLVMTATPIPRTLSLVLYGDLDVSIIDELPPNRKPVKTYAVTDAMRERVYNFIRRNVAEGRQAYIVCPLVEDSEQIEAESAEGLAERIRDNELSGLRVGLIHGKMKPADKDEVMRAFVERELDVLVSTTVIEVGVNVPNANIMVIENAERFGLAQLHQLRGRVGRGEHQSYCILFNQSKSEIARQRMAIMVSTNDGFVISEKDLELRGPGDVFGIRQHGLPEFKIANLYRDMEILKDVQRAVKEIIDNNLLANEEFRPLREKLDEICSTKFSELSFN